MFWTLKNSRIAWAPEDGTGTPPAPASDTPAPDAGSVLYPDDKAPAADEKPADTAPKDGENKGASEWKEYTPDPSKSAEENAAAKAERDKTKPAADKADIADKVPEDGKYALTMPEGVEVDQELLDELGPEFKAAGLTTKQAQAIADKFIAKQQARIGAQSQKWSDTIAGWADEAKKDPEIGGAKWDGTVKAATGVVGRFGSPGLKEFLNSSGAGNHPEMIRFMAKVGAVIGEDDPAISENPGKKVAQDSASILYPDDQPKGK